MSSIKLVLRKKLKNDGTMPICLRITKDRKTSFIHLGYYIKETEWDDKTSRIKKSHPNSSRLNNLLLKKLAEANDNAIELETKIKNTSAKAVKEKVKPKTGATFFPQADSYLNNLRSQGKYNQFTSDRPRVEHFKEFLGNKDVAFSDISPALLEDFKIYLRALKTYKEKSMGERSVINHLVVIRSVYAYARRNNVITKEVSPFGENGVKIKFPESTKIGLNADEIKRFESVELDDPKEIHARNLWLFSFYFAGMRVSDVLRTRWSDIQNKRLHYAMGKNQKAGSLKIPDKAYKILEYYEKDKLHNNGLIFPELKDCDFSDKFATQRTIAFKTSAIDKVLHTYVAQAAQIEKKLTMHLARHSFGSLAGDKIAIQMLQKLYRHSSVLTTIGYQQNFIHKDADEALEAVLEI